MSHNSVPTLDYIMIIGYFVSALVYGSFFAKYTKSTKDFFISAQRFSWWLIGLSCISTTVGSYSFIKYSEAGYNYGLSSTQTYLNDWFLMPLFLLGWVPLIYFSRVTSIPEFFERRFSRSTRLAGVIVMIIYLCTYIGFNFYTLGVAFHALLGWNIFYGTLVVAVITGVYTTFGGQTAVVMNDLVQGLLLLIAGFVLFFLGVHYLGGWEHFWHALPVSYRLPFSGFNTPPQFPMVGIFWQDGMANSFAHYFFNQGLMLRFLAAKSVREGRKAALFNVLLLMPLCAVAVSNAGWLGKAMVGLGILPADVPSTDIFVKVSQLITVPGVFGLIMAALTAAMMGAAATYINGASAIMVNDVWKPFLFPNRTDKHYLKTARVFAVCATLVGIALVPVFNSFHSVYRAHASFTAAITPPMVITIFLGILWKKFTPKAAFSTMIFGIAIMFLSLNAHIIPFTVAPLAKLHGVGPEGYVFMRAFFGIIVCAVIGVGVSLFTKPKDEESIRGLVIASLQQAKEVFKGSKLNDREKGETIKLMLKEGGVADALIHPLDLVRMKAEPGDLLYVADKRVWLGGLKSVHTKAASAAMEKEAQQISAEKRSDLPPRSRPSKTACQPGRGRPRGKNHVVERSSRLG